MFTPPKDSVSDNQIPEAKTAAEQPAVSGFQALNPAKIQREFFRGVGTILTTFGVDASAWTLEVQKARLFEAIVKQHTVAVQQELGITLDVWTHAADLQKYAASEGYLGDASHMSKIEGQLRTNALQGPKLVLSMSPQPAVMPLVVEEHKEAVEAIQRPLEASQVPVEASQVSVVEKPAEPVAPDYPKILKLMEAYKEEELRKIEEGQDTSEAVWRRLAPYEKIEKNVRLKVAEQQAAAVRASPTA